jgi:HAD superfamily hydrolase (TIGR01549 family)
VTTRARRGGADTPPAALVDIDGTLVDTNYHHALAWYRALRAHGVVVPLRVLHRRMGMGGDQLVEAVAGADVERRIGDDVRAAESELYGELIDEVELIPGARELLRALADGGRTVVLASSAKEHEVDRYLDMLGARELVRGWTTSADVEATKPEPDLVVAALEKAGGGEAVVIGDSTWDVHAATRAGLASVAVLTGGIGADELREAGAAAVYDTLEDLRAGLGSPPLA